MKRALVLLLLCCLLFGLTACYVQGDASSGEKKITFTVTHGNGDKKTFELTTDAETLAEALLAEKLVEESAQSSGLYDVVDGEKADWNDGEAWWRFSENGKELTIGIEELALTDGGVYEAEFVRGLSEMDG